MMKMYQYHENRAEYLSAHQESVTIYQSNFNEINDLNLDVKENDVCVYWYFGSHGLKQGSVDFYKEHISSNICKGATPCLVDLTAWGCFERNGCPSSKFNRNTDSICSEPLIGYKTSSFFTELRSVTEENEDLFALLKDILSRESLREPSIDYAESGKTLSTAIGEIPLINNSDISDLDTAKCYSLFQYIEFFYIVKSVLQKNENASRIRFHLPNDENKYYPESTLVNDLRAFLVAYGVVCNAEIHINCFNYSNDPMHRPYNAPGKVIKKQLTIEDAITEDAILYLRCGNSNTI